MKQSQIKNHKLKKERKKMTSQQYLAEAGFIVNDAKEAVVNEFTDFGKPVPDAIYDILLM